MIKYGSKYNLFIHIKKQIKISYKVKKAITEVCHLTDGVLLWVPQTSLNPTALINYHYPVCSLAITSRRILKNNVNN